MKQTKTQNNNTQKLEELQQIEEPQQQQQVPRGAEKTVQVQGIKCDITHENQHRNGITATPFNIKIFECEVDGIKRKMVAIQFADNVHNTAVLDIEKLSQNDIGFGKDSWGGEHLKALFDDIPGRKR